MYKIFVYSKIDTPRLTIGDHSLAMPRHNQKWFTSSLENQSFTLSIFEQTSSYTLPGPGIYAVYKKVLIEVEPSPSKVLLITDIDNTIFNETTEGMSAYSQFISFWIKHFEFNGSKLVYNTGRSLKRYNENKPDFYEPDLFLSVLGNYAYRFDENGEVILLEAFNLFVRSFANQDWDSKTFIDALVAEFPFMKDCLISYDPFNTFFKVPKDLVEEHQEKIKEFSKNKEGKIYNGIQFKGKTVITSQGMVDHRYIEIQPEFGGKGLAVRFAKWFFSFIDESVVLAGDSLNDRDAFKTGLKGVVVGNAEDGLVQWLNRKERKNLFRSNEVYALGVVDYLRRFHLRKTESAVFVYRDEGELRVEAGGRIKELKRFKGNWDYFLTDSERFVVQQGEAFEFCIEVPVDYAVYERGLIKLNRNISQILLVTDIDNTVYNHTEQGREYYRGFIKSWISNFEFNGSRLVYNSGRNLADLLEDKDILFRPEIVHLCLGTFAYVYDDNLKLTQDPGYEFIQNKTEKHDWDSLEIFNIISQKFGIKKKFFMRSYDTYILLKVKNKILDKNLKAIKSFLKNKENLEYNGKIYKGRVCVLKLGLKYESYVEIVPLFLGKRLGVMYATTKFGFGDHETYVSGDSPNDIDSLKYATNKIVMKNSEESLFEWVQKKPRGNIVVTQEPWGLGLQIEIEKFIS